MGYELLCHFYNYKSTYIYESRDSISNPYKECLERSVKFSKCYAL